MSRQAVLGVENARFNYGAAPVFSGISFQLDGTRTALVGENGAGKSTLLKCLMGELDLDEGQIIRSRSLKIGYVPQDVPAEFGPLPLREVLENALLTQDGSESWRVDVLLDEMGVSYETSLQAFSTLSGGWQRLLLIAAAAALGEPDLLILDEPTNHLDLSNINRLELWLSQNSQLPMLIVSHDREFLERNTTRTIFLRSDGAHSFAVPFTRAREALLHRDAADAVRRQVEGKEIERLEKMAARYKIWGVKNDKFHKRMHATERRIDRIEAERTDAWQARERRLELHSGELDARIALRLENYTVTTPDGSRNLFKVERLAVAAGDRIAILGTNGTGKSMLLNAIARTWDPEAEHYDGQAQVRFNPKIRLAFFDQAMASLPLKTSLLDFLIATEGATNREANALLAQAGFPYVRIKGPIGDLSYGERARLSFLQMKLTRPNLYLLDEPTNHLDIEGQEDLEAQLEAADVACLFVSHDRYFTRTAATRFVEIRKGRLVEIEDPEPFFEAQ